MLAIILSALPTYEEEHLLLQVAGGNDKAFRQLFYTYHQPLAMHVFRLTQSVELAEEIVQDVFLKIWTNRETLTEVRNFRAYLFVVSKNQTLNALRKLAKERDNKKAYEKEAAILYYNKESEKDSDYYNLIDQAIGQLPPQQQKVYCLSRHNCLKYQEIAQQLNISRETVKKYMQLAIASIGTYVRRNMEAFLLLLAFLFQ